MTIEYLQMKFNHWRANKSIQNDPICLFVNSNN